MAEPDHSTLAQRRRQRPKAAGVMAAVFVLVMLVMTFTIGLQSVRQRDEAIARANGTANSLARIVEEHAGRAFSTADLFLKFAADTAPFVRLDDPVAFEAFREQLIKRAAELPQLRSFFVFNEAGDNILDSHQNPPRPINVRDRQSFSIHAGGTESGLYIGPPLPSPLSGEWTIVLTRALTGADGRFGGVVAAALEPAYFTGFYERATIAKGDSITLYHVDGLRIARQPDSNRFIGTSGAGLPLFQQHLPQAKEGLYLSGGEVDGIRRYVSYRQVSGFPLVVTAAISEDGALAQWRASIYADIAIVAAAAILSMALAYLLQRQVRTTHEVEQRLRDAIESLDEGFVLYDAADRLVLANNQFYRFVNHDPGQVRPGITLAEMLRLSGERNLGHLPPAERERTLALWQQDHREANGTPRDVQFRMNQWVRVVRHKTADGGRIATFADITDLKQAEQRVRDAIEAMPDGFALYNAAGFLLMANRRFYEITGHDPGRIIPGVHLEDMIAAMVARRGEYNPALDAEAHLEAMRRDFWNPSGLPVDAEFKPGKWLRTTRHRTADGGLIAIHSDISDLKLAEQRLLDAINGLSEGFALYDADGRLKIVNANYYRLTRHDPAIVKPGVSYTDVMRAALALQPNVNPGLPIEQYLAELTRDFERPSGQPMDAEIYPGFWLRTVRHRTAEDGVISITSDISDLKLAEQRLLDAIEIMPEGFLLYGNDRRLLIANSNYYRLTRQNPAIVKPGATIEEILEAGRHVVDDPGSSFRDNAYLARLLAEYDNPTGEPIDSQPFHGVWLRTTRHRTRDGGIITLFSDISDLKRAEQRLLDAIAAIDEGFILYDVEGRVVLFNERFVQMYPLMRDEIKVGARFEDLLRLGVSRGHLHLDMDKEAFIQQRLREFKEPSGPMIRHTREGRWLMVQEQRTADGGLVSTANDITELKRQQEALETSYRELEEAKRAVDSQADRLQLLADQYAFERERADAANKAKSDFLAMMSHEIRTPLNGVLGTIGLLEDGTLTDAQRKLANTARESAEHLLSLINDILDFSKLEAGRIDLETIDFDLPRLIESVVSMMQPRAIAKGLDLKVTIPAGMPHHFRGDPSRIRQVMFNLLGNALKFTDSGSVELAATAEPARPGQWRVTVTVTDTGIGIAQDKIPELFTHFTQADRSISRRYGGTGLGLAICKQLVELMGGRIGVESEEWKGSRFWFTLDLAEGAAPAETMAEAAPGPATQRALRVLVAEDNQVNQLVIGMMLRRFGHQVDMVNNGHEACEAVVKAPYDIVLMDVQMPVMDGIAATRTIRRLPAPAGAVPIVALTANAMPGDREVYLSAGMNDYATKPIELPQLLSAMNRALPKQPTTTAPIAASAPVEPAKAEAAPLDANAKAKLGSLLAKLKKQS